MQSAGGEPAAVIDFEHVGPRPWWWDAATFVLEGHRQNHFGGASIAWVADRLAVSVTQLHRYSRWAIARWPLEPALTDHERQRIIAFYQRTAAETSSG